MVDLSETTKAENIKRARQGTPVEGRNAGSWVSESEAFGALAADQQRKVIEDLAAYAFAEGSALQKDSWKDLVDPTLNKSENIDILLENGAEVPEELREQQRRDEVLDRQEEERQVAQRELLGIAEELDESGVNGGRVLENLWRGRRGPLADAAEALGVDIERAEAYLTDMEDAFGRGFIEDVIDEAQGASMTEREAEEARVRQDLLEQIVATVDIPLRAPTSVEDAAEQIAEYVESAEERERARILRELEVRFGIGGNDSIEELIGKLSERVGSGGGPRVQSAPITARQTSSGPSISFDTTQEGFARHRGDVTDEARRVLRLENLPRNRIEIGVVRLEDGEVAELDFSEGQERLGKREGEDVTVVPEAQRERERRRQQMQFDEPETKVEQMFNDLVGDE